MASPQSVASIHHLHPVGEVCPTCDQPIPHERAEEISRRLDEQEKRQAAELTAKLQEGFDLKLAEATERARLEADDKVAKARVEAKTAAESAAQTRVEAAAAAEEAAKQALVAKTAEAEAATAAAAKTQAELAEQLGQSKRDAEAQLAQVRTEAAETLATGKAEATRAATEAAAAKIQEAEEGKTAAETATTALQAKLSATLTDAEEAIAQAKAEAAATAEGRVTEADEARRTAVAQAAAAQLETQTLKAGQENALAAALQEQRDALEADKANALSTARSQAFAENQKLLDKVGDLQRTLDKKTAEELGEGAEIDLYETLRAEFEGDRFERIKKGLPGADIRHTVIYNGQICGVILYDSKNHNAWRNDFIAKLRADQLADNAEHAILTVLKFPQGARQLHVQDGVLVANPARVAAIVEMLRRHMIQTHTLRMSSQQRAEKTAALYDFITSDQCAGMFERLDTHAQQLLDIQVAEKAAHERVWKQQGITIRSAQKVQTELRGQIDAIIGTAQSPEEFI